jgi:hypothetical protein
MPYEPGGGHRRFTVDETPHIRLSIASLELADRPEPPSKIPKSAYGTSTVRSPGASVRGQICSTSASGIVVAVTAIVPAVISATSDGSSTR